MKKSSDGDAPRPTPRVGQTWEFLRWGVAPSTLYLIAKRVDDRTVLLLDLDSGQAIDYRVRGFDDATAQWRRVA